MLLLNLYTADTPVTKSRKFIYTKNSALKTQRKDLSQQGNTLTDDLNTFNGYFRTWQLNSTKF